MQSDIQLGATATSGDGGYASVPDNAAFIEALRKIVGKSHVLTGIERTRRFCTGFRFGHGPVTAVVRPGSLVEQWRVLKAAIAANKIVIMQAANTGLTGGSTPDGDDYDRGIVLINTMRITASISLTGGSRWSACRALRSISSRMRCIRLGVTLTR